MAFSFPDEDLMFESFNSSFTICVHDFSNKITHKPGQAAELDVKSQAAFGGKRFVGWLAFINVILELLCGLLATVWALLHRVIRRLPLHKLGLKVEGKRNFLIDPERRHVTGQVFANGIDSVNEGHVSILIQSMTVTQQCSRCIVEVVDAVGEKRFSRSFSFPLEKRTRPRFVIERYIKRETLLAEALELLPDDCLTLHVHVCMGHWEPKDGQMETGIYRGNKCTIDETVAESFTTQVFGEERKHCLSLDSEVFAKLREASSYFQTMFELPMEEKRTRRMNIPDEELPTFLNVCRIVMGSLIIRISSLEELCDIYVVAKKYFLPTVNEICRRLFVAAFRSNFPGGTTWYRSKLPLVYELAETYDDALLQKILESLFPEDDHLGHQIEEDFKSYLTPEWSVGLSYSPESGDYGVHFYKKHEESDERNYNFYQ